MAELYGVTTKRLNEQVKRNHERFPADFMFQLTKQEKAEVVAICDHLTELKYSPSLPHAFTEHGAIMAASALKSSRAVEMSIFVVRAFVRLRKIMESNKELADKLAAMERKYDARFKVVFDAIRELMTPPQPTRKRSIGFAEWDEKLGALATTKLVWSPMESTADFILFFLAAYAAAAISGAAGFGGALLLLPFLVASVGATQAVPLLTVAQIVGNLSRVGFGFTQIRWKPVGLFMIGALPLAALGALFFTRIPAAWVTRAIGAAILVFVALQYFGLLKLRNGRGTLIVGGGITGFLSGLVGSTGPLGAAIFLSLGLPPVAYIASEAVTALAIHGVKIALYQNFISLDRELWILAAVMGGAMILGTWTARRFIERIPRETFKRLVGVLLAAIAAYMLIHG